MTCVPYADIPKGAWQSVTGGSRDLEEGRIRAKHTWCGAGEKHLIVDVGSRSHPKERAKRRNQFRAHRRLHTQEWGGAQLFRTSRGGGSHVGMTARPQTVMVVTRELSGRMETASLPIALRHAERACSAIWAVRGGKMYSGWHAVAHATERELRPCNGSPTTVPRRPTRTTCSCSHTEPSPRTHCQSQTYSSLLSDSVCSPRSPRLLCPRYGPHARLLPAPTDWLWAMRTRRTSRW